MSFVGEMFHPYPNIPARNYLGPIIFSVCFHVAVPLFLHTSQLLFESQSTLPEVYTVTLFNAGEAPAPPPPVIEQKTPEINSPKPVSTSVAPEAVSLRPRKFTATKKKKKKVDLAFKKKELSNALDRIRAKQAAEQARREKEKAVNAALAAIQSRLHSSGKPGAGPGNKTGQGGATGKGPAVDLDNVTRQYYASVTMQIQENWILPEFQSWPKNMQAVVSVKVLRNGEISDIRFERKSSSAYFNQFVLKTVQNASPLPRFPQKMSDSFLEIGLRFTPHGLM